MPHLPSGSHPEDGADSGLKVRAGYLANFLSLPYTLPAEWVATDFDEAYDSMEVQASIARYLIKALNPSHSLARRSDALENARAEAREKERALRLQVQELIQKNEKLTGENEKLKTSLEVVIRKGKRLRSNA
ncbi:hypothetical protein LIER_36789 [Lithospermum erythrorhizon]|uniref:Uncharacterized protein n=1 Tax=Lithospermum erythrorhizon TaxID=34254 RepID=A0AAV3PAL6_LITER